MIIDPPSNFYSVVNDIEKMVAGEEFRLVSFIIEFYFFLFYFFVIRRVLSNGPTETTNQVANWKLQKKVFFFFFFVSIFNMVLLFNE
jgi:hypothetical protein